MLRKVCGRNAGAAPSPDKPHYEPGQAFDVAHYDAITKARLQHLRWMNLPVANKTVIELGSGIGRMAEYFVARNCTILCTDGRPGNIAKLKEIYPDRPAAVVDLATDDIFQQGKHDIVFCYGLLYHVADVLGVIGKAARICREMILLETVIAPVRQNACYLVAENPRDVTQAICGYGSRPSPSYVVTALLLAGFKHVYRPARPPAHPQFRYRLRTNFPDGGWSNLTREIFIASFKELDCPALVPYSPAASRR